MARYRDGILNMTKREFFSLPEMRYSYPPVGYMRRLQVTVLGVPYHFVIQRVHDDGQEVVTAAHLTP